MSDEPTFPQYPFAERGGPGGDHVVVITHTHGQGSNQVTKTRVSDASTQERCEALVELIASGGAQTSVEVKPSDTVLQTLGGDLVILGHGFWTGGRETRVQVARIRRLPIAE